MQEHTKTHPTEALVTLRLRVSRANAEKVKNFVAAIASGHESDSISYEAFFEKHFPGKTEQEITLAGYRYRENLTQQRLADVDAGREKSRVGNGSDSVFSLGHSAPSEDPFPKRIQALITRSSSERGGGWLKGLL